MATDLESFARHRKGGKSGALKINIDDVRMLDRRHADLVRLFRRATGIYKI